MINTRVDGRVSVVVLNWNSGDLGAQATESAFGQRWPDVEVIVVDNASDDDSLQQILDACPDVVVVRNEENLGFGGGMNAGFAVASGAYFLPLNCDAKLDPDYISVTARALDEEPGRAGAGGLVASPRVGTSGPLRITRVMRTAPLPSGVAGPCDKLNGACPLFRAAALDEVIALGHGPYDDRYFVYGEDIDLACTLTTLGWEFRYEPTAQAEHVRSYGSAPRLADRRGALRTSTLHNRHRNIVRHSPRPWVVYSGFALTQDVGFVGLRLMHRDWAVVSDMIRAWRRAVGTLAADRRRRRQLRRVRP
jgi:GT2 family glycosyltransferase